MIEGCYGPQTYLKQHADNVHCMNRRQDEGNDHQRQDGVANHTKALRVIHLYKDENRQFWHNAKVHVYWPLRLNTPPF